MFEQMNIRAAVKGPHCQCLTAGLLTLRAGLSPRGASHPCCLLSFASHLVYTLVAGLIPFLTFPLVCLIETMILYCTVFLLPRTTVYRDGKSQKDIT